MHFLLANWLWWLLPLAGIPLLSHWLNRRYPKKFEFSSIDEIRRTMAGRTRVARWRHLLMLLLRTCALLALLGAFLKPMLSKHLPARGEQRRVMLMVDHSLSMAHRESGTSARARARAEVERLLATLGPDDTFNLIRVDHAPAAAFPGPTTHKSAALDYLDRLPEPLTTADFGAANHLAAEFLRDHDGPVEIYYFSDFQRRDWADVSFAALPPGARLLFVSATAEPKRPNRAIRALELAQGAVIAGGVAEAKARVANSSPTPWTGKVEVSFDPAHAAETEITLAPWAEGDAVVNVPAPSGGLLRLTAALPPDALDADNRRHLVVKVSEREEVVILTGLEANPAAPPPELYLSTAVNPYGEKGGIYHPRHLQPAALTPAALGGCQRLIASRLPALTDDQAGTLAAFVKGGGGMILFLDGGADPANLVKLGAAAGQTPPLRPTERLGPGHFPDGALRLAHGDFRSRFLALFEGVRRQNLGQLEFYEIYHAAATGSGKVLLSYADGTPALAECQFGLGTLLVCNFSVAETASNLARQRLFPAWIHELLRQLCHSGAAAEPLLVGDSASGETWTAEAAGQKLLGPTGIPHRCRMDPSGERMRVLFTADATGFYRLPGPGKNDLLAFAANTEPGQSDLRTMDPSVLPVRAGANHADAEYVGATADYDALRNGKPAAGFFLLAALAFLLLEGVFFKTNPSRALGS